MAKSHLLWGKTGDPTNLKIQWHTPSVDEKSLALRILHEFLKPSMLRLRQLMSNSPDSNIPNTSHELTNELCRNLAIMRNCLIGSMVMISDDGETSDVLTDE
jgi:proteasome activator subunit 4